MQFTVEVEREEDGRWITEVPELPSVLAYGASQEEAVVCIQALALRVMADRIEHGEDLPEVTQVFAVAVGAAGHRQKPSECWRGLQNILG